MEELYSIDYKEYRHRIPVETDNKYSSPRLDEGRIITDARFKELLLNMPKKEQISHQNLAFKISKDSNSLRISLFDYDKVSVYQDKTGKHQLEKKLYLIRFIIKIHSNNFYVSTVTFSNRRRRRSIKQNTLRTSQVDRMVTALMGLLDKKYAEFHPFERGRKMADEVGKITAIIFEYLDVPTTQKAISAPLTVKPHLRNLFRGAILEWFCRKNNIHVDHFWLTELMSHQYITKKELKKYDNNYLKAFLDYYKMTPAVLPYIKSHLSDLSRTAGIDFVSLSLYEKVYPKDGFRINFESETRTAIETFNEDDEKSCPICEHSIYLKSLFKLSDTVEREEFSRFLKYLEDNKRFFREAVVINHIPRLNETIRAIAELYRMGLLFKMEYLGEIIEDSKLIHELNEAVFRLSKESHQFVVQQFAPKYKSKVEKVFTLYGTKWSLKLYVKPLQHKFYGNYGQDFTAFLTNVKTDETLELSVANPSRTKYMEVVADKRSFIEYYTAREVELPLESLMKDGEFLNEINRSSSRKVPRKAPPQELSKFVFTMNKVYGIFYDNSRYFRIDNKILTPILEDIIRKDEFFNKYLKIKR